VTDRQTDGQTDRITIASTCLALHDVARINLILVFARCPLSTSSWFVCANKSAANEWRWLERCYRPILYAICHDRRSIRRMNILIHLTLTSATAGNLLVETRSRGNSFYFQHQGSSVFIAINTGAHRTHCQCDISVGELRK